jgi:hypothetical protein
LQDKIEEYYNDIGLNDIKYLLHAVFAYHWQADDDHQLVYIRDWHKNRWLRYDNEEVKEVNEDIVLSNKTDQDERPYYLVYVDAQKIREHMLINSQ